MNIGYARVSTDEQNLDLQSDELKSVGCERIFTDTASGAKADRPGLAEAIGFARPGDTLTVWKLDRLGRSLQHLIETMNVLADKKVGFRSLRESIDTTTPGGKLIFHLFGSLSEFERELIRERTHAGLASARARGRLGGRPKVMDKKKAKLAATLYADKKSSVADVCEALNVSKATFYRHFKNLNNPTRNH